MGTMTEKFTYEVPEITRDEATELCVWHLRMAASLFQVVPDDRNESLLAELERQVGDDDTVLDPAVAWADIILTKYRNMIKEREESDAVD